MTTTIRYPIEADASSFKRGMAEAKESAKAASGAMEEWTKTQQRAAQRMEAMHEEALKLNTAFKSGSDDTQRHAEALRAFDSALGGPITQTKGLSSALDLTNVGMKGLTQSVAGFNAQTAGVVGAGLAMGTTLGALLNQFKAVRDGADDATRGLYDFLVKMKVFETSRDSAAGKDQGIGAFSASINAINAQAFETVKARLLAQGKTIEDVAKLYKGELHPAIKTSAMLAEEMEEKHKKAVEAAKKHQESLDKSFEMLKKQSDESAKFWQDWTLRGIKADGDWRNDLNKAGQEAARANIGRFELELQKRKESYDKMTDAMQEWAAHQEAMHQAELDRIEAMHQKWMQTAGDLAGIVDELAGILNLFGVSAESALGRAAAAMQDFSRAGQSAVQSIIAFSSGNILAGIGAGLGALGGIGKGIKGLFFGGQDEHKKVNDMRDEFVRAAGGLDELNKKAHGAGTTLDHLLNAKTVKDYQAAIEELNGKIDETAKKQAEALNLQTQAQQELNAAAEKYGFTTQNMADTMGGELLKNYELLNAAGFDHAEILKRMAPDLNEYVQTAIKAGQSVPENFRPILEQMVQMGLLTDENGKAFGSLEEAGITFTESLTDGMKSLIEEIRKLVEALTGVPSSLPDYSQGGQGAGGGANPPARGGPRGGERFADGGYQAPGPESWNLTGSGGGEYHVPGGPDWMSRLAAELGPYLSGGGSQTMAGKLEVDLKRGVGELVAEAYSNNEGGVRQTIRRDLGLT